MIKTAIISSISALTLAIGAFLGLGINHEPQMATTAEVASNQQSLSDFTSIDIDAISPDIKIVSGEDYAVSYNLHEKEHIDILEVKDGVLYFDTGYNFEFEVDYGDFFITITIPADTALETVDIKTVAGDIYSDIGQMEQVSLITISGEIEVENSSIAMLSAKSTSEDIMISGNIAELDLDSVAGDCLVKSENMVGKIATVSGQIELQTAETAIAATSFGQVKYHNNNMGYRYENSANPNLELESVSGKIIVDLF